MKYELAQLEDLVKNGYLRKVEKDDLVLYGYTDQTTFERAWQTMYTRNARGLIFDKNTGRLVAKPFPKFFNLGEQEETQLLNLPLDQKYQCYEKCDGSLGIMYFYNKKWNIATRGSFTSEQAIKAEEILKKYDTGVFNITCTYLLEIIYPENKIIVNYGSEEKLVMLSAYHTHTERECEIGAVFNQARNAGMPTAKEYGHTLEQMIELQKTLPKDQEGFVVRFENGLRVKIKGDEYSKIAKMISQMSYLSFWEAMKFGKVSSDYLKQLPEEFRAEYEPLVEKLELQYQTVMKQIGQDLAQLPVVDATSKEGKKTIGLFLQGPYILQHPHAMFTALKHDDVGLERYIMKQIRPDGNEPKPI
jgi:RNA ligase